VLDKLEAFAALLRRNRVRVSVAEVVDAVEAVRAVGLSSATDLRAALGATLAKRPGDRSTFDELFTLYFLRGGDLARGLEGAPLARLLADLGLSEDDVERLLAVLADRAAELSAAARAGLGIGAGDVPALLRMSGAGGGAGAAGTMRIVSPLHIGYHTHRLLEQVGVGAAERELAAVAERVRRELGEEAARALAEAIARNLAALRQAIRRHVQDEFERQNRDLVQDLRLRSLSEKPFSSLREDEIRRLRVEVVRLARKLRAQASRRPRHVRRGRLDVRRTLRRSLAAGGVPFELKRKLRRKDRPRLVILCDISDSVRHVSRFMLELVYTLQELFARVRSFVFVSDLGEVTQLFAQFELDRAIELAYGGAVIPVQANSNYGRALEIFATRHLDAVSSRTTVIVIGDARNNYNPPNAERLAEVRRRAKRVLWLNPELPGAWGFGDSAMRDYEPHVTRAVVAYNLESLRKVVDELVL
jgi:uncharacterized protein with von Willebrand factor type A (vWA) domain